MDTKSLGLTPSELVKIASACEWVKVGSNQLNLQNYITARLENEASKKLAALVRALTLDQMTALGEYIKTTQRQSRR